MPRFEMALTRREFARQLQPLLDGWSVERLVDRWRMKQGAQVVEISCHLLPARRMGALELPRMAVEIDFSGCGKEEEARFLLRFQRYFQRGGG